jgi:hypothetical protein
VSLSDVKLGPGAPQQGHSRLFFTFIISYSFSVFI